MTCSRVVIAWTHVPESVNGVVSPPGASPNTQSLKTPLTREVDGRSAEANASGVGWIAEVLSRQATTIITEDRVCSADHERIRRADRCLGHDRHR